MSYFETGTYRAAVSIACTGSEAEIAVAAAVLKKSRLKRIMSPPFFAGFRRQVHCSRTPLNKCMPCRSAYRHGRHHQRQLPLLDPCSFPRIEMTGQVVQPLDLVALPRSHLGVREPLLQIKR